MKQDRLQSYRNKRDPSQTSEPFDSAKLSNQGSRRFMVHHHLASREHYDLRLAHDGVLISFAVPKGPSMDPSDKRLAVHVEDHPLTYADYEGVIPEGQYGAGPTLVWDTGRWKPEGDVDLSSGKLSFTLFGYKLQGRFALIRTRRGQWLLKKKADDFAHDRPLEPRGVLSGLTSEELADTGAVLGAREEALRRLGCPEQALTARAPQPMLAETSTSPDHGDDWLYELKIDGYRLLATRRSGAVTLTYRSGRDATTAWPEVARVIAALPGGDLQIDGEVTVQDGAGLPSFHRVQSRGMSTDPVSSARKSVAEPATFYAFDLLHLDGHDTRQLPLTDRKALLFDLVPPLGAVRFTEDFSDGAGLYAAVLAQGLEGIMAKRRASPYQSGRHADWLKIPCIRTIDAVIVGWTERKSASEDIGALVLGLWTGQVFRGIGKVGTGLTARERARLLPKLRALEQDAPTVEQPVAGVVHWVAPDLVARVRFARWTDDSNLFHARYEGLSDVSPSRCVDSAPGHEPPPPTDDGSNRDKVFWPKTGTTKGALLDYYDAVSPVLLPWLADRPVTLVRYPDGVDGTSFFQKHVPEWAPDWVRSHDTPSESGGADVRRLLIADRETLLWAANLGAIALHIPAARLTAPDSPDWLVIDLDPKTAPFVDVVRIAQALHALCERIGVPMGCKTSGRTGLHCIVPLGGACDTEQARTLADLLAQLACAELPDIATMTRSIAGRGGRVYVDTVQNGRGKQLACTWSAREGPTPTASTPLSWDEVNADLDPAAFTLDIAASRALSRGDTLLEQLGSPLDLEGILEAITELLQDPSTDKRSPRG